MFDPQSLSYRNRRIQKQAQILRSKGTTFIPQRTYGPNDYKEMQKILIANKIQAYVPDVPPTNLPIQIDGISQDGSTLDFPFSSFNYTATGQHVSQMFVLYFQQIDNRIDVRATISAQGTDVPANSIYYSNLTALQQFVFHSPTIGYFLSADITTIGTPEASLSFNADIFQLTGLPESS